MTQIKYIFLFLITGILLISCGEKNDKQPSRELDTKMNDIAENYVKVVLKVGQFDPDYVDAYYGPAEWKPGSSFKADSSTLKHLDAETDALLDRMESLGKYNADELQTLRFRFLYKQMLALKTKIFMLGGGNLSFDQETKALYDAEAPHFNEEHFKKIIDELDKLLPGSGNVTDRFEKFRSQFIIPKDKLDKVFTAAINECRKITLSHIQLPSDENFKVEYVNNKPWSGYNWYKGNSYSLIQVNTDLPIYIDRAVDLAAHEGYPGHHVYNTLLEKNLVRQRNWVEFTVYPLFSPQSLIAEGTANFGIEMAFPGESRIKFEKEVLFPIAGLDSSQADEYYHALKLVDELSYAGNEAARNYLNGDWGKDKTIEWLQKYDLMSKERAEKRIDFINKYRSYVINYNLGKDIVKNYIEKNGGTPDNEAKRWEIFQRILSTPQTPSGLQEGMK
jgi:hypothetical protein